MSSKELCHGIFGWFVDTSSSSSSNRTHASKANWFGSGELRYYKLEHAEVHVQTISRKLLNPFPSAPRVIKKTKFVYADPTSS